MKYRISIEIEVEKDEADYFASSKMLEDEIKNSGLDFPPALMQLSEKVAKTVDVERSDISVTHRLQHLVIKLHDMMMFEHTDEMRQLIDNYPQLFAAVDTSVDRLTDDVTDEWDRNGRKDEDL